MKNVCRFLVPVFRKSYFSEKGFSFVEFAIALSILSVGVAAAVSLGLVKTTTSSKSVNQVSVAREIMSRIVSEQSYKACPLAGQSVNSSLASNHPFVNIVKNKMRAQFGSNTEVSIATTSRPKSDKLASASRYPTPSTLSAVVTIDGDSYTINQSFIAFVEETVVSGVITRSIRDWASDKSLAQRWRFAGVDPALFPAENPNIGSAFAAAMGLDACAHMGAMLATGSGNPNPALGCLDLLFTSTSEPLGVDPDREIFTPLSFPDVADTGSNTDYDESEREVAVDGKGKGKGKGKEKDSKYSSNPFIESMLAQQPKVGMESAESQLNGGSQNKPTSEISEKDVPKSETTKKDLGKLADEGLLPVDYHAQTSGR